MASPLYSSSITCNVSLQACSTGAHLTTDSTTQGIRDWEQKSRKKCVKNMGQFHLPKTVHKQFLINAVITRILTFMSLIMHTFVYRMKMSRQILNSYGRI